MLTASAYFLADTVDTVIGSRLEAAPSAPVPIQQPIAIQPRRELGDYSSILDRGLFGDGKAAATPAAAAATPAAAAETTNYRLVGTVEGGSFAGAVLEDSSGQTFYRLNQKMPDGSAIIKVMHSRIHLKRASGAVVNLIITDDTKIVPMQPGAAGALKKLSNGRFAVDQKDVLASTDNINQVLTQARALPYQEQGKTVGFRITEIVAGSIYDKIGLKDGDVIQRVNAQDVDDPAKFFQLYQGLRNERSIAIDLIRNGQRQSMNYEIQ